MRVGELIEYLEDLDQDAEVKLMTQPSYPFEYTVASVTTRKELLSMLEVDEDDEDGELTGDEKADDVFIVEGSQQGYGDKNAWN